MFAKQKLKYDIFFLVTKKRENNAKVHGSEKTNAGLEMIFQMKIHFGGFKTW